LGATFSGKTGARELDERRLLANKAAQRTLRQDRRAHRRPFQSTRKAFTISVDGALLKEVYGILCKAGKI